MAPSRPWPTSPHWAAELHQLAAQAAEVGTRVALEPLPFSNITDFRLAAELVAAADHPAAGLVVDIWHLERGPSTLADLAQIPGDKVFVVELNDAPAPQSTDLFHDTIHHRVLCGSGTFDVKGFVATLQQIGFAGPWGVEIISDEHRQRPLAGGAGGRSPHDDGDVRQARVVTRAHESDRQRHRDPWHGTSTGSAPHPGRVMRGRQTDVRDRLLGRTSPRPCVVRPRFGGPRPVCVPSQFR